MIGADPQQHGGSCGGPRVVPIHRSLAANVRVSENRNVMSTAGVFESGAIALDETHVHVGKRS